MTTNTNSQRFGDEVRRLRKAKGWSQEYLAERLDLSRAAIGQMERGETGLPKTSTLQALQDVLGLSLRQSYILLGRVPPEEDEQKEDEQTLLLLQGPKVAKAQISARSSSIAHYNALC